MEAEERVRDAAQADVPVFSRGEPESTWLSKDRVAPAERPDASC